MRALSPWCGKPEVILSCLLGIGLTVASIPAADGRPGYLRNPAIHGDQVLFHAEGDLWLASLDGGAIRRLTSHPGDESLARFSPDGKWIAFTGDYDGNADLFVIPSDGGEPRRLTWHPDGDFAIDWTPDGKDVIFRSSRDTPHGDSELFRIPFAGGDPEKFPLGRANSISIEMETGRWAFTRTWGGGTWKRYRGGTAPNIWVGHPDRADFVEVTDFDGIDLFPMWHKGRIYFLSDQGGTANIWSMKPDGSDRARHTDLGKWDARSPSIDPSGRIVFVVAGDIHLFDPTTGKERTLPIDLPSERVLTRKRYPDAEKYLSEFALSPDGERVAVVARGEILSVPVKEGVTLPVTRGSGARERAVDFHPKGKRVIYITDESGEQTIVTADAWGQGEVKRVKGADKSGWHFQPLWSPDGEWIAYADMTQRLYVLKADGGTAHEVDHCEQSEITQYSWSPDGRWLAYAKNSRTGFSSVFIYDTKEEKTRQVTGWSTDDFDPTWDPKGRYLYFLSNRTLDPLIGTVDFETICTNTTRPYLMLLRSDVENPLLHTDGLPPKDEEKDKKDDKKKDDKAKKEKGDKDEGEDREEEEEKPEPVEIEFEGLAGRFVELPVDPGQYRHLTATEEKLFYLSYPLSGLADMEIFGDEEPTATIISFDMEEKEAKPFQSGVDGFHLQPKADKILFSKGHGQLYVVGAGSPPGDDLSDSKISLDGIVIELDPNEEWRQVYHEAWRFMRDFYWEEQMHGIDWKAIRDQYAELLPRIATRSDLRDLLAEMIGELSTSHTYVWGATLGWRSRGVRPDS